MNKTLITPLLLSLLLAACGGSGSDSSGTSSSTPMGTSPEPTTSSIAAVVSSSAPLSSAGPSSVGQSSVGQSSVATSPAPVLTGVFLDAAVANIGYRTPSLEGRTNSRGEFNYRPGEWISFFIGALEFPRVVAGDIITPLEIANTNNLSDNQLINILRLLQSLDADGDASNGIDITSAAIAAGSTLDFTVPPEVFAQLPAVRDLLQAVGGANKQLVAVERALAHFQSTLDFIHGPASSSSSQGSVELGSSSPAPSSAALSSAAASSQPALASSSVIASSTPALVPSSAAPSSPAASSQPALASSSVIASSTPALASSSVIASSTPALASSSVIASSTPVLVPSSVAPSSPAASSQPALASSSVVASSTPALASSSVVSSSEAASSAPASALSSSLAASSLPLSESETPASSSSSAPSALRPAKIEGFAAHANVTGGAGGAVVTVTTGTELNAALCSRATMSTPITILVNGTINHGNTTAQGCNTQADVIEIKQMSNVSIIGVGTNALFEEIGIHARDASNIIIQNVHVRNVKKSGSPTSNGGDAIGMETNVDRVWIDHNHLEASGGEQDGYDSLLDFKAGVTNVTVSYNLFNDSSRAGLIGSSDSDDKNTNLTYHHNWYKNIQQRTPLIRHALVHMYNNYWSNDTIDYMYHGINSRANGKALVESNYFYNVNNPLIASDDSSVAGCWQTNNENTVLPYIYYSRTLGNGALVVPEVVDGQLQSTCSVTVPYTVEMDSSALVPTIVMANVGVGKIAPGGEGASSSSSTSTGASSSALSSVVAGSEGSASSAVSVASSASSSAAPAVAAQLNETFDLDKTTLFSAAYQAISTDASAARYFITGGGSGISLNNNELTIAGGRLTIGHRPPRAATTAGDTSANGDFDLSRPYRISFTVVAASGAGKVQVYIDNSTTSSGNSIHGANSKVFEAVASSLTANQQVEITPAVGTATSFIALRTESSASVTIDNLMLEYLDAEGETSSSASSETVANSSAAPASSEAAVASSSAEAESSSLDASSASSTSSSELSSAASSLEEPASSSSSIASSPASSVASSAAQSSESAASESAASEASASESSAGNSLLLNEVFNVDKTALFSAAYQAISTDASAARYFITGGGSGITLSNNELSIAGGRLTIGHRPPRTNTTAGDTSANGDFDLSRPYRISFTVVAASGAGKVQVYIDNSTTSSGNSLHGANSKVFEAVASTLTANQQVEITPAVGTATSFIALRAESSATVVIDNLQVEYTDGAGVSSSSVGSAIASSQASSNSSLISSSTSSMSSAITSSAISSSISSSSSSAPYIPVDVNLSADCISLATNPNVNWRDTSLQSDQEIVECLSQSLGKAVGYGEKAKGGYDTNGNSKLTIITKSGNVSVEQQLIDALTDNAHNWIVFDKLEFAQPYEIGMYRQYCADATTLSVLGVTEAECRDYRSWCASKGFNDEATCRTEFFNKTMNKSNIPIRIPAIGSNKTLDGRMSEAYFLFSGFAIGKDSDGVPTQTSESVILTHLKFQGAGHTEDHYVDPDMIRSTGASHDIWIHKNTFDTTGDSAFDVKIGANAITMSFNRLQNVKRAVLHGSSDSRTINANITTTMHHNAFVTTDDSYMLLGNTLRRVPLLRRGKTHMFNNLFVNYRKEILSLRVGASAFLEDNAFVVNSSLQEKSSVEASLAEISTNYFKDISGGSLRNDRNFLWFGSGTCVVNDATQTALTATNGSVADLAENYNAASLNMLNGWRFAAGQDLVDYVTLTAGKHGDAPFNSPLSPDRTYMEALTPVSCQ